MARQDSNDQTEAEWRRLLTVSSFIQLLCRVLMDLLVQRRSPAREYKIGVQIGGKMERDQMSWGSILMAPLFWNIAHTS